MQTDGPKYIVCSVCYPRSDYIMAMLFGTKQQQHIFLINEQLIFTDFLSCQHKNQTEHHEPHMFNTW